MDTEPSGSHLLRHVYNAAMPLDGRLRMLNAYLNRADSLDDLGRRLAAVAAADLPASELDRLARIHRESFA